MGAGYTAFCRHFQGLGDCPHWQVFMRCQQNDEFESLKGGGRSAWSVTLRYILPSLSAFKQIAPSYKQFVDFVLFVVLCVCVCVCFVGARGAKEMLELNPCKLWRPPRVSFHPSFGSWKDPPYQLSTYGLVWFLGESLLQSFTSLRDHCPILCSSWRRGGNKEQKKRYKKARM